MKKIIIIIAAILLVAALMLGYYFIMQKFNFAQNESVQTENESEKLNGQTPSQNSQPTIEEIEEQNKENYPDVITGKIYFLDNGTVIKTTIKTADGKEYVLSPDQPKVIYESFGAKNGGSVKVQGKITTDGKLEWILITPI
jgi:hypothetical protein